MKKLVSIGMSVYNCSRFIEAAITSIIKQTYTNWELIIIDDGSTDDTLTKINAFNDSRIKVFSDSQNKGLPTRLNECIELSSGFYFARMDGDDIMMLNRLEKQVKYLEDNINIDVLGSIAVVIDDSNRVFAKKIKYVPQNLKEIINSFSYFIHPTVIGRLEWFKKYQYDVNAIRVEDIELWIRSFDNSKFFILDDNLIFYRENLAIYRQKYYFAYIFGRVILQKHRAKISNKLYYITITKAYIKYLFFYTFKQLGLLNRRVLMSENERIIYQKQLDEILEIY